MGNAELSVVTGAFGFTGKYITRRLLAVGKRVRTLTGHPDRPNAFGDQIEVAPFCFDNPAGLTESLRGATTLYNTYWIRFEHKGMTFQKALENTKALVRAAEEAGVRRIVHTSITNPSEDSPLPYFRGKALAEKAIVSSTLSYAILRPAAFFGAEAILINNIAWMLRRLPVFGVPGSGDYKFQPIFVEDFAELAVEAGGRDDNVVLDAVGPEVFTFDELVRLIRDRIRRRTWILHVPPGLALLFSRGLGLLLRDKVLTRDEVRGLLLDLLVSQGPPTGQARLSHWLEANAETLGRTYLSELARHYR